MGDDRSQFSLPGFDDRHEILKNDAGQGGVGGVAVGGEADGFGFGEMEVLGGWNGRGCREGGWCSRA